MDRKVICFDFDGVCAEFDEWKGHNVFGKPILETARLIERLKNAGHLVILWTCRSVTHELWEWLRLYGFKFDSINENGHNPSDAGIKPYADLYIDDRAFMFHQGQAKYSCDVILIKLGIK